MKYLENILDQLQGKKVLIRADLNVPQNDAGEITDDQRIQASIPTIEACLKAGATVFVTSHLGRPSEGVFDEKLSLKPIAERLSHLMQKPVKLLQNYLDQPLELAANEAANEAASTVYLLENCRFNIGEKANSIELAQKLANLCDVFVHDAFGTAHRAEASTHQVANFAPMSCAGLLLAAEYEALTKALAAPTSPTIAIVGGSKVSTKLSLLTNLSEKVDQLILGGGIANTFLAAMGHSVGASLYEKDLLPEAQKVMQIMQKKSEQTGLAGILLPIDVVVFKEFSKEAPTRTCLISEVQADEMIVDFGPETQKLFDQALKNAKTILWNGPVGVFEFDSCAQGTHALAQSIAHSEAFSIAGGGDTLAAISKFAVQDQISYISTGGGAFLEFLEGKELPAFAVLTKQAIGV